MQEGAAMMVYEAVVFFLLQYLFPGLSRAIIAAIRCWPTAKA